MCKPAEQRSLAEVVGNNLAEVVAHSPVVVVERNPVVFVVAVGLDFDFP